MHDFSGVKNCFILLTLFASALSIAKVEVRRQGNQIQYEFELEDPRVQSVRLANEIFSSVQLKGVEGYEGVLYKVGEPAIPVIRFYVDGDARIEIESAPATVQEGTLAHRLRPNQEPIPRLPNARAQFKLSSVRYETPRFLPEASNEVEYMGTINGVSRRLVTLYPFQYNPVTGRYRLQTALRVHVERAPTAAMPPPQAIFAMVVGEAFATNPELVEYAKQKGSEGFLVQTVVVNAEMKKPENIRAALRRLYLRGGLRYVLLVGDQADVPGLPSERISSASGQLEAFTDHYYRCLDTDDYEKDLGTPDVGVGRISVRTSAELSSVLRKQIKYARRAFTQTAWQKQVSFIGTDDWEPTHWQMVEGTHNRHIELYTTPAGLTGDFPTATLAGGDKLYATSHHATQQDVFQQLQKGRVLVDYGGHGGVDSWSGPVFTIEDVQKLSHPDANPVVFSQACYTGKYDQESFAEAWQRHPQGSILFLGSMDVLYWDPADDLIDRSIHDAIFLHKRRVFADFVHYGISEAWRFLGGAGKSAYYWETYVLFGDASMSIAL